MTHNGSRVASDGIRRLSPRSVVFTATIFALVAFLPSLWAGFVFDDEGLIVDNPFGHALGYVPRCFTTHLWDISRAEEVDTVRYYRPLVCASYVVNWVVSERPWAFHFVNWVAHAAATALAARFALRWAPSPLVALAAALVFAVHPSRTEAVIWVSGRTDILMAFFGFAALEVARTASSLRGPRSAAALVGAALLFVAALLCKEPAAAFVVLAWADAFRDGHSLKRGARGAWVLTAVVIAYVVARAIYPVNAPPLSFTGRHGLFTVGAYVERAVVPWPQTFFYRPLVRSNGGIEYPWLPMAIGIAALAVYGWLVGRAATRGRAELVFALGPVAFLLPLLHFFPTGMRSSTSDRFLYVPVFLAVLVLARAYPRRTLEIVATRSARFAFVGVLLVWLFIDGLRTQDYLSEWALWRQELSLAPDNPIALRGLARQWVKQGDIETGAALYERSVEGSSTRYVLIDTPRNRLEAYVRAVSLGAARTPDGDTEALQAILSELRAVLAVKPSALKLRVGGVHIDLRPGARLLAIVREENRSTLLSEAAFVAARLGRRREALAWLSQLSDERLDEVPNLPNLVLTYGRALDFAGADRRLEAASAELPAVVQADLRTRLTRARAHLESKAPVPVRRALALSELGAMLAAARELRPLYLTQTASNDIVALYVQLLVGARLEDEALRACRAWFGAAKAESIVASLRAGLPPRLRELPPVDNPSWWVPE